MHLLGNADTEVSIGTRCIRRIIGLCLGAAALMLDREVPYTCVGIQIVWSANCCKTYEGTGSQGALHWV